MNDTAEQPPLDHEAILERVSPNIRQIAAKTRRRTVMQSGYDADDLYQEGLLAAYHAIDRYDATLGKSMDGFLAISAKGAMLRYVRDKGSGVRIPRTIYETSSKLMREIDMNDRKGSYERFDEVKEKLDVGDKVLKEAYDHIFHKLQPLYLDQEVKEGEANSFYNFFTEKPYDVVEADRLRVVRETLESMRERDRSVFLSAISGVKQTENGKIHGISQMQISRIVRKVTEILSLTVDKYERDGDAI